MAIGTISREELIKRLGVSQKDYNKLKSEVYEIISLVSGTQDIKISRKDLPDITLGPGESSAWDGKRNQIRIGVEKIGDGESYAAEVGHFLRDYVTNQIGTPEKTSKTKKQEINDLRVHEFYDRAAVKIAKSQSEGTKLEPLFEDITDYSTSRGRLKLAELGKKARKEEEEAKRYEGSDSEFRRNNAENERMHFQTHAAYALADQYSAEELMNTANLYRLTNDEVKGKFLRRKRSGLETKISIISIFLGSLILISQSDITAAVIGTSINNNFSKIGLFLVLIGVIFFIKTKRNYSNKNL